MNVVSWIAAARLRPLANIASFKVGSGMVYPSLFRQPAKVIIPKVQHESVSSQVFSRRDVIRLKQEWGCWKGPSEHIQRRTV